MVNLLVGSHLSSHKLSLGSLIPTVSPKTTKIPDISLHIIVSSTQHLTIHCLTLMKSSARKEEEREYGKQKRKRGEEGEDGAGRMRAAVAFAAKRKAESRERVAKMVDIVAAVELLCRHRRSWKEPPPLIKMRGRGGHRDRAQKTRSTWKVLSLLRRAFPSLSVPPAATLISRNMMESPMHKLKLTL
ncbi:hypothetical protein PIB30_060832 [Stylosanthes scabra]|uniref:Uncharacterized protein n=1 Tax=Stylosanthes scabra TaxID=79078 RepID=A0ABU6SKQ1_9FABA|nr:hypothetical protein [Stylosanthes scabra]